jgi:hypothetical protein
MGEPMSAESALEPAEKELSFENEESNLNDIQRHEQSMECLVTSDDIDLPTFSPGPTTDSVCEGDVTGWNFKEKRYCFDCGQIEYLIERPSQWKQARYFHDTKAEKFLEEKFRESQSHSEPKPKSPYHARHGGLNLKCVDTTIGYDDSSGFHIQWRDVWTKASDITNVQSVQLKYEIHLDGKGHRRSRRLRNSEAQRETGWNNVMEVVRII